MLPTLPTPNKECTSLRPTETSTLEWPSENTLFFHRKEKANGFSLIISLDSNEHARSGNLARSFHVISLFDSVSTKNATVTPALHSNGSNLLDKT